MEHSRTAHAALDVQQDRRRVAVIAVHGIADQRRGVTAEAIALQLAGGAGALAQRSELLLDVKPVDPVVTYKRWKPTSILGRIEKSWLQSVRSDFIDKHIGADPTVKDAAPTRNSAQARAETSEQADVGVRYTDYLLSKAHAERAEREQSASSHPGETHTAALFQVHDTKGSTDVYEMYWADLSRLAGSPMRIVTELFTLLFRLSHIGVDTLALEVALTRDKRLCRFGYAQRAADWLFSRVLAMLALQLAMCALLLVLAVLIPAHLTGLSVALVALSGVAVAAGLVYWGRFAWSAALLAGIATTLAGAATSWWLLQPAHRVLAADLAMLLWIALLSCGYWALLRFAEERFKAVFGVGLVLYAITLACVVSGRLGWGWDMPATKTWVDGGLFAFEAVLLGHALGWGLMGLLLAGAVGLGLAATRGNDAGAAARRQAVVTARLGLFTSVGVFLAFLMVAWGITSAGVERVLAGSNYEARYEARWFKPLSPALCGDRGMWWFTWLSPVEGGCYDGQEHEPAATARIAYVDTPQFLQSRHANSSASFAPVSLLLLCLIGFIALLFLPSVLIEARRGALPPSARLGRWLTTGYRSLERFVPWWALAVLPLAALAGLLLLWSQWQRLDGGQPGGLRLIEWFGELSRDWVSLVVTLIAGGAVSLIALGAVAARQLRRLRAPLDSALDVDNHFREFPRAAIPRVRIVERYVALLDHVLGRGYERVVIVAHSQGTVISAELLRYLQQRERLVNHQHPGTPGRGQVNLAQLKLRIEETEVALLTVGCPLRQLYALRFPSLYGWVLSRLSNDERAGPGACGPRPSELGVRSWTNLWASGDYVGRWLWSADRSSTPLALSVADERYESAAEHGSDGAGAIWKDGCIGADAHTHYFDIEQGVVKAELAALVR